MAKEEAKANEMTAEDLQAENAKLQKALEQAQEAAAAAKIDAELAQQEKEAAQAAAAKLQAEDAAEKTMTAGQKQVQMERRMMQTMEQAKQDTVKIRLPYLPGGSGENEVFVGVNGYRYQIQRGIEVEVPRFVAEVLENSEKQKMQADMTMRALQEKAAAGERVQAL